MLSQNYMLVLIKHHFEDEMRRIWKLDLLCDAFAIVVLLWSCCYVPQYATSCADIATFDCSTLALATYICLRPLVRCQLVFNVWLQMLPFDCDNNLLCACNYYYYGGIVSLWFASERFEWYTRTIKYLHPSIRSILVSVHSSVQLIRTITRRISRVKQINEKKTTTTTATATLHTTKTKGNGISYGWQRVTT